jgi:glutaminyl-peptide cyclotransferase
MFTAIVSRVALLAFVAACNGMNGDASARTTSDVTPVSITPREQDFKIVATYPHDPAAWTQGLFVNKGSLIECTGQEGKSYIREVEITTGNVKRFHKMPDEFFGEGCVLVGDKLFQLTWQNHKGFVYNFSDFSKVGEWSYPHEGWGLTYDGTNLILSDGSATLRFLNPRTYAVVKTIEVTDNGVPVRNLNELEMVKGELFANIWMQDSIARINPTTGNVGGWIVLKGLLSDSDANRYQSDVLNGIAYDAATDRLFVTGKHWPKLFEIKLVPHE